MDFDFKIITCLLIEARTAPKNADKKYVEWPQINKRTVSCFKSQHKI